MQLPRFLLAALTLPTVVTQTPLQTLDAEPQPSTLRLPSRLQGAAEGSNTMGDVELVRLCVEDGGTCAVGRLCGGETRGRARPCHLL